MITQRKSVEVSADVYANQCKARGVSPAVDMNTIALGSAATNSINDIQVLHIDILGVIVEWGRDIVEKLNRVGVGTVLDCRSAYSGHAPTPRCPVNCGVRFTRDRAINNVHPPLNEADDSIRVSEADPAGTR